MHKKINEHDAKSIRIAIEDYDADVSRLAKRYGVHRSVIENIKAGNTFRTKNSFPDKGNSNQ